MSQLFLSETVGAGVGRGGGVYEWQLMVFALRFPIIHKKFLLLFNFFFVTGICEILELFSIADALDYRSLTK